MSMPIVIEQKSRKSRQLRREKWSKKRSDQPSRIDGSIEQSRGSGSVILDVVDLIDGLCGNGSVVYDRIAEIE